MGNTAFLSDSDRIEQLMAQAQDGVVTIGKRHSDTEPERDWWLIDRAILLPANTTVVLRNCKIKLSDTCRDNFFRSANCGIGIADPEPITNIHIRGEGVCVLEGADHPRSTGDGSKILACPCPKLPQDLLKSADWVAPERREKGETDFWDEHSHSFGTDAGKDGETQSGDWRNIGILFANADHCSIRNLRIVDPHCWAISWEGCSFGSIENVEFDACMAKQIDGLLQNMENQDGIDLRNGCHDIFISGVRGGTGDDIVALTAIDDQKPLPGGRLGTTHVMPCDYSKRDRDIHDIVIRDVMGYSKGHICNHVRLLPVHCRIYRVVIDGVVDTSPAGFRAGAVLILGLRDDFYGENSKDSMRDVTISNVICDSRLAIRLDGYLSDSVIRGVVNRNPDCAVIRVLHEDGMMNVKTSDLVTAGTKLIEWTADPSRTVYAD